MDRNALGRTAFRVDGRRRGIDGDEARVLGDEVMRERERHDIAADVLLLRAGEDAVAKSVDRLPRPESRSGAMVVLTCVRVPESCVACTACDGLATEVRRVVPGGALAWRVGESVGLGGLKAAPPMVRPALLMRHGIDPRPRFTFAVHDRVGKPMERMNA